MNQINDKEAFDMLHKAGFTELEIKRLTRLRREYKISEMDQAPLDYARLRFARWLVATGRLTDQLSGEDAPCAPSVVEENAACAPLPEKVSTEKVPMFREMFLRHIMGKESKP